ncbi:hypothetical protein DUI87_07585 [Hirundo rustica rustica]|uniref:PLAT domain-containing protein n=1 Tax=Hirundo rustica rustica TaxID=333673 RepID=A0A3M0KVE7_HIRRU|nr:hypothetical protein DUI87_07585 [Hirundo rustica rustica]
MGCQLIQECVVGNSVKSLAEVQVHNIHSLSCIRQVGHLVIKGDQVPGKGLSSGMAKCSDHTELFKVKLQHRDTKNVLEFPFYHNFADEEVGRVTEIPVFTAGSPFPSVKIYVPYITTGANPGSGIDSDVYVMLQGSLGDTGRRKLIRNGDKIFTKGKAKRPKFCQLLLTGLLLQTFHQLCCLFSGLAPAPQCLSFRDRPKTEHGTQGLLLYMGAWTPLLLALHPVTCHGTSCRLSATPEVPLGISPVYRTAVLSYGLCQRWSGSPWPLDCYFWLHHVKILSRRINQMGTGKIWNATMVKERLVKVVGNYEEKGRNYGKHEEEPLFLQFCTPSRISAIPMYLLCCKFTKLLVDIFRVEAVDIGILKRMVVEKGGGSDWLLEKIIVKESASPGAETLFMAQTWLKDRRDGKRSASVTLDDTGQHYLQTIIP